MTFQFSGSARGLARSLFFLALSQMPQTFAANPAGMTLIKAKGLSFMMGMDKSEFSGGDPWAHYENKHKVSFTYDFYLDTTMITQGQYKALMGSNPSGHNTGDMNLPVEKTSWYDAVMYMNARSKRDGLDTVYSYRSVAKSGASVSDLPGLAFDIKKNGYRIPTNAEYEYAERAGTTGMYFFAPDGKNVDAQGALVAWYTGNSGGASHPVATKKPNPWGLYDMTGNLFEWCNDWNAAYPTADEVDPIGAAGSPEHNKVAKGGSFKTDIGGHMRIPYHYKWGPSSLATLSAFGNVGEISFRAARTVTGTVGLRGSGIGSRSLLSPARSAHGARLLLRADAGGPRLFDLGGRHDPAAERQLRILPIGE